ncbi:MAG: CAF17-like 4Fe-4S cluster assembly/insertion protein YgfZ [Acidimicrobiales bacterium]
MVQEYSNEALNDDLHEALNEDHSNVYRGVRSGCLMAPVEKDIISVHGPDALKYLQGQITQDLSHLEVGNCVDSFILQPSGAIVALVRVTRIREDELLIDVDAGWGKAVAERLAKFKIRTKAAIETLPWIVAGIRGTGSADILGIAQDESGIVRDLGNGVYAVPLLWPGLSGYDLFYTGAAGAAGDTAGAAIASLQRCLPDTYQAVRIEAGLPVMGREIDEHAMPAATGLVVRAVSFSKGCYVGQELVERVDARGGESPQRLCGLVGISEKSNAGHASNASNPAVGGTAEHSAAENSARADAQFGMSLASWVESQGVLSGPDAQSAGRVTSAAWSPGCNAVVCLAYLSRKIDLPATVEVTGVAFHAMPLPLWPGAIQGDML